LADALHSFPATKTLREIKRVTTSERARISYLIALTAAPYVVLSKENHMQSIEAATLDRKSGVADLSRRAVEGSAVLFTLSRLFRKYPLQQSPPGFLIHSVALL
jgi:hypothetical protein